jgi:hypothetical protein
MEDKKLQEIAEMAGWSSETELTPYQYLVEYFKYDNVRLVGVAIIVASAIFSVGFITLLIHSLT